MTKYKKKLINSWMSFQNRQLHFNHNFNKILRNKENQNPILLSLFINYYKHL